jgi:hypothetical protein
VPRRYILEELVVLRKFANLLHMREKWRILRSFRPALALEKLVENIDNWREFAAQKVKAGVMPTLAGRRVSAATKPGCGSTWPPAPHRSCRVRSLSKRCGLRFSQARRDDTVDGGLAGRDRAGGGAATKTALITNTVAAAG